VHQYQYLPPASLEFVEDWIQRADGKQNELYATAIYPDITTPTASSRGVRIGPPSSVVAGRDVAAGRRTAD